jgi:hypothetical protein
VSVCHKDVEATIEEVMAVFPLDPPESVLEKDVEHLILEVDDFGETLHLLSNDHHHP